MPYLVEVDTKAAKEIRALPRRDQEKIISKAEALADDPRPNGCVKLSGPSGLWRIRAGEYRIIVSDT
jgi:mRNA interferase RelE/StbE